MSMGKGYNELHEAVVTWFDMNSDNLYLALERLTLLAQEEYNKRHPRPVVDKTKKATKSK